MAILVTAGMAAISMSFALVTALKAPIVVAIIFALLWGVAIMSLDRLFVASMHRYSNRLIYLLMAAPRFVMAVLLGLVISTPFVLVIFRPEITHQIKLLHAAERSAYFKNLPRNPVYLTVQQDKATVSRLADQAATGGSAIDPAQDPTIKGWESELATAQKHEQTWFANLQCQLYGTKLPGDRKCVQGNGPLAHDDQQQWKYWKGQVTTLQAEIQKRTTVLQGQSKAQQKANQAQAASQLGAARQALKSAEQQLTLQTSGITGGINKDNGLLTQLKALGQATAGDSTLAWARLLLFLVFLLIDIMPVFIKLLLNLAPESTYDMILAEEERMEQRSAENDRAARQAILRKAAQAEVSGARDRLAALTAELPDIREEIIAARLSAEREWLERYRTDQRRRVASGQGITPADTGVGRMPTPESWDRYARPGSRWPRPRDGSGRPSPPPGRAGPVSGRPRIGDFLRWPDSRRPVSRPPDLRQPRRAPRSEWRPWPANPPVNGSVDPPTSPAGDWGVPNAGPRNGWTPPPDPAPRADSWPPADPGPQFGQPDAGQAGPADSRRPAVPPGPDSGPDPLSPPEWVNGNGNGPPPV